MPKTRPYCDKRFVSYGKLKQKSLSPAEAYPAILFLINQNPW